MSFHLTVARKMRIVLRIFRKAKRCEINILWIPTYLHLICPIKIICILIHHFAICDKKSAKCVCVFGSKSKFAITL